jgi:hypothetical protein
MDDSPRKVPFLAPVFAPVLAKATAPVTEAVGRLIAGHLTIEPVKVPCPASDCGAVCAWWLKRRLYRPGRELGLPLGADDRDNVALPCPRCGRVWHSSGRGVGYRLRKGLPPLA